MDDSKFLSDLQSDNADARFAAWRAAGDASPAVIPQLGKIAASAKPGVAKAGREALTTLTHSVGKDANAPKRAAVVKGLLELGGAGDLGVRVHAIRLLSNIAGEDSVAAIARWFANTDLREEVAYCIERIPGPAADKALIAAYSSVPDDFKPRILAALGHRRVAAAADLCAEAAGSSNPDIAIPAGKALARIGKPPSTLPRMPNLDQMPAWNRTEMLDSLVRYAELRTKESDHAEALRIYRIVLNRPEEHWQCAAIVGLARIGTAEAAAVILPKLKSDNSRIRITAQNAWKGIANRQG